MIVSIFLGQESSLLEIDTVSVRIANPKKKKPYAFDLKTKMVILLSDRVIKNQIQAHDYLIKSLDYPKQGELFLKIYNNRNLLFAAGIWNEMGFLGEVYYYKKGKVVAIGKFKEGDFLDYK
jgi:hypothetical protein